MSTLSVVIITNNEEANIGRCLEAVKFADEIIVIDSQSTDRTVEIAEKHGAKAYTYKWRGFGAAKREGVRQASGKWILSIDADEIVTVELASEIKQIISGDSDHSGFYLKRMTMFLGRWIKHSGWYPDYVLRLFKKNQGNFMDSLIHEKVVLEGKTGKLRNHIRHFSYPDIDTYFRKLDRYTTLSAKQMYEKGKRFHCLSLLIKPIAAFCRHYFIKAGFLDGVEGFLIASFSAFGTMIKYTRLRSLEKSGSHD